MQTPSQRDALILGSRGFLGSTLLHRLPELGVSCEGLDRSQLDLASPTTSDAIRKTLAAKRFGAVLVCAAISDVDRCFQDPMFSEAANVAGTLAVLRAAREFGALPIFFSSDYVFGREGRPAREDSPRKPETVYGRQKAKVEEAMESEFSEYVIFRFSKLMARFPHPRNFLFSLAKQLQAGQSVRCFSDQRINGVFVEDIALAVQAVLQRGKRGIFHLAMQEELSRLELAQRLAACLGLPARRIVASSMAEMGFSEPRPTHNTLDCRQSRQALELEFREFSECLPELQRNFALGRS
jgi:dTDP-4-dehydrorhamnose reductase